MAVPSSEALTQAKDNATFKQKNPEQEKRASRGSYYAKDLDKYSKIRVVDAGGIQSKQLDHDLLKAIHDAVRDDGKVDAKEVMDTILPKVLDGRWNRKELTRNERWTIRYALGEYAWDFDARIAILNAMFAEDLDVLDGFNNKIEDKTALLALLQGPTLEELQQPPTKKGVGQKENQVLVDGMFLDKDMLMAVRQACSDDGVVDAREAVKLFHATADDDSVTLCERWTLRFLLASHVFTDAAFNFIKEAVSKLSQNDSLES